MLTAHGDAFHHLSSDCDIELAAAVVVKEVQRLGTLHEQIVDGHGH